MLGHASDEVTCRHHYRSRTDAKNSALCCLFAGYFVSRLLTLSRPLQQISLPFLTYFLFLILAIFGHFCLISLLLAQLRYTAYISPIAHIAYLHRFNQQQYADYTQLFISLSPSNYIHDLISYPHQLY